MSAPVEPRNARPYLSTCVTPRPRHKRVLCSAASCIDVHCNTLNDKKSMLALFYEQVWFSTYIMRLL